MLPNPKGFINGGLDKCHAIGQKLFHFDNFTTSGYAPRHASPLTIITRLPEISLF